MAKVTRRQFLKGSAAAAVSGKLLKAAPATATVTEVDFGLEKKVPQLCRMCAQQCPMLSTVRDGRLVRVEANMTTPYGGICGRGRSAMGALYDPDRIKTPLIRVGERGEGKFRKATWDEALDMVAEKMNQLKAEDDAKSVAFLPRFNSAPMIDKEFFAIYGTPNVVGYGDTCFGNGLPVGLAAHAGGKPIAGVPAQGTGAMSPDYENAKYGLLLQRNPGGGLVVHPWGTMFGLGKKNGLQVTVVDPRKPSEAGESDADWLPIRPGTDAAFLLGLMHQVFSNGYYDAAYLAKHTSSDMLIDPDTGLPVQTREIEGKKGPISDYLVATADGPMFKSEAGKTELLGSFDVEVDGVVKSCKTGLQAMKDAAAEYTPEWTEKVSDVPAARVIEIAKRLNDTKPACFIERGYRSERYASTLREKLLITQMNMLLGAFGVKGGIFYNRGVKTAGLIKKPKVAEISVGKWYLKNDPNAAMMNAKHYRRTWVRAILEEKPYKQRMAVIAGQNPIGGSSGGHEIAKALQKLEMVAVISPFFNETAMFADVILPDCTFMERDEPLRTKYKSPLPTMAVNRKAVEPLWDSKDGYWIILQLAKRTLPAEQYAEYFAEFEAKGVPMIWKKQFSKLSKIGPDELATVPPLEAILDGQVWVGKKKYGVKSKGTSTGKLEVYSTYLASVYRKLKDQGVANAEYANPLPIFNSPFWLTKKESLGGDEFIPITGFHPLGSFTGQQTRNNPLLRKIAVMQKADAVYLNAAKGAKLGLKDGDIIEIANIDEPELVSKAEVVLSELVHPDALYCNYGMGAGYFNRSATMMRHSAQIGFNPNHVSNFTFSPLTGGMPAQDFIVRVRRSA